MSDIDHAINVLRRANSHRAWLRAAAELRGFCHGQAELACPRCRGAGSRPYSNSSGWKGGAGVSPCEDDVCDECWGTGRTDRTGVDLRELTKRAHDLENEHGRAASGKVMIVSNHDEPMDEPIPYVLTPKGAKRVSFDT